MTINEYLNTIPHIVNNDGSTVRDQLADQVSIWSENACRGYCIESMRKAGLSNEKILHVLSQLQIAFDDISVKEAENIPLI